MIPQNITHKPHTLMRNICKLDHIDFDTSIDPVRMFMAFLICSFAVQEKSAFMGIFRFFFLNPLSAGFTEEHLPIEKNISQFVNI